MIQQVSVLVLCFLRVNQTIPRPRIIRNNEMRMPRRLRTIERRSSLYELISICWRSTINNLAPVVLMSTTLPLVCARKSECSIRRHILSADSGFIWRKITQFSCWLQPLSLARRFWQRTESSFESCCIHSANTALCELSLRKRSCLQRRFYYRRNHLKWDKYEDICLRS